MSEFETGALGPGRIETRELEQEMRSSYLDYAMSVIVGRALPDVRDGLKPVHRRVLFSMSEQGLAPNRPYRKCARVVGEVMGQFHPHGDQSIYDTLVRLAQDHAQRYPLVDGQGNFGSIDNDPPAAMRYTESRMTRLVTEMPYQVYKGDGRGDGSGLIVKLKEAHDNGRLPEITDLRDESDRNGIRLVIELKRDAIPKVVLNKIYKHTPLQTTFGVNMVA